MMLNTMISMKAPGVA